MVQDSFQLADVLVTNISDNDDPSAWGQGAPAVLTVSRNQDSTVLQIKNKASNGLIVQSVLAAKAIWRATGTLFMLNLHQNQGSSGCYAIRCPSKDTADKLQATLDAMLPASTKQPTANGAAAGPPTSNGGAPATPAVAVASSSKQGGSSNSNSCVFDQKTDKGSADMYFHYYGMVMHQQNMLQDYTRTGTYHMAILENRADFQGKVVMDVGAGSGILSLFAAQAGARKVYAVEASGMAKFARRLADGNPSLAGIVEVRNTKVEELELAEKADVLVSEPMGTLLVNERMLESYIYARDKFLKPGGKMFPQIGRIHAAAFQDDALHAELLGKALFWTQSNFYGVDVTPLYTSALESYFAQVVVDAFDPSLLASNCVTRVFDMLTIPESALHDITIPLQLHVAGPRPVHGVACWFDVMFNGSSMPVWLSTAPGLPTTHWFQLRCTLQTPIYVPAPGALLVGQLRLLAHARQSYDVHLSLQGPPLQPGAPPQISTGVFDLKEPYYRQLSNTWWGAQQTATATAAAQQGAANGGGMAAAAPSQPLAGQQAGPSIRMGAGMMVQPPPPSSPSPRQQQQQQQQPRQ